MHLEHLPSGRWRAIVSYGGTKRKTAPCRTKRDAETAGAMLLLQLQAEQGPVARRPTAASEMTVGELIAAHVAQAEHSATYAADVERVRQRLPAEILRRPVAAVTPMEVDGWWARLARDGWTPHRVQRAHTVLSAAFGRGVRWGIIRWSPLAAAPPPRVDTPEIVPPSPAVVARLIAAADVDACFGAFVRLAAATGARRGELLGLRWGDVDLDAATVTIRRAVAYTPASGVVVKETKSGRKGRRTVRVDADTLAAVQRHRLEQATLSLLTVRADAYLFSGDLGDSPRRPDWATQRWHRLCESVGVECRLHDLRHALASSMLAAGVDPVRVSRRLGHSRTSTTVDVYGHLIAD